MEYVTPDTSEIAQLAGALAHQSRSLRASGVGGYQWVFPALFHKTTRDIHRGTLGDGFEDPLLIQDELVQFYEAYARNSNRILAGLEAEPHWARVAKLSRSLEAIDPRDRPDRVTGCLLVAMTAVYAHVAVDLPRALLLVHERHAPRTTMEAMRIDYDRTTAIFTPVMEELVREGEIAPPFLRKHWDRLPGWLQRTMVSTEVPFGTGIFLRSLREFAWMRFRSLLRNDGAIRIVWELPGHSRVTPLEDPLTLDRRRSTRDAMRDALRVGAIHLDRRSVTNLEPRGHPTTDEVDAEWFQFLEQRQGVLPD